MVYRALYGDGGLWVRPPPCGASSWSGTAIAAPGSPPWRATDGGLHRDPLPPPYHSAGDHPAGHGAGTRPLHAADADIARFVDSHRAWLDKHLAARQSYMAAHPEPSAEQAALWRRQAAEQLPPLVHLWAQRMGVQPTGITITAARTRFGSCSGKNRLSFSLYLMAYPPDAIEYVVVHELAHIRHHDHSPSFTERSKHTFPIGNAAATCCVHKTAAPTAGRGRFFCDFHNKPPPLFCAFRQKYSEAIDNCGKH